jgi:hypothetical protein
MIETIFEAENMNEQGICRGWVCNWVSRCKQGATITSRHQLSNMLAAAPYNAPNATNNSIDASFGLIALRSTKNSNPPVDVTWIATELTKGTGYFVFGVRGKMLNIQTGSYNNSGHAMATRKGRGKLQFFDPNTGLYEFGNTFEFFGFLPGYVDYYYPDLLSREAEIKVF